jgi:hypothetical protein
VSIPPRHELPAFAGLPSEGARGGGHGRFVIAYGASYWKRSVPSDVADCRYLHCLHPRGWPLEGVTSHMPINDQVGNLLRKRHTRAEPGFQGNRPALALATPCRTPPVLRDHYVVSWEVRRS